MHTLTLSLDLYISTQGATVLSLNNPTHTHAHTLFLGFYISTTDATFLSLKNNTYTYKHTHFSLVFIIISTIDATVLLLKNHTNTDSSHSLYLFLLIWSWEFRPIVKEPSATHIHFPLVIFKSKSCHCSVVKESPPPRPPPHTFACFFFNRNSCHCSIVKKTHTHTWHGLYLLASMWF